MQVEMERRSRPVGAGPGPGSRRGGGRRARGVALCLGLLGLAGCATSTPGSPDLRGWNVLLVTIDTLRADRVGCYGHERAATPVLDALAAGGVRFETVGSPMPITLPSHASIMTGTLPIFHGSRNNAGHLLSPASVTLAERFRAEGYATTAVVGAKVLSRIFGLDQGFESYDDDIRPEQLDAHRKYRRGDVVTDLALDALGEVRGRPFFAWVHYYDPHAPYAPPEPFAGRFPGAPYDGEVAWADHCLGRLLEGLDRLGLRERTLVVVTSDHGEGLKDPHGEQTHGILLYEETLRVPLILHAPGALPGGRTVRGLVRLIDLAPTLLELTRIEAPADVQGLSLAEAIATGRAAPGIPSHFETLMPAEACGWAAMSGLRIDDWKFIEAPKAELFDLAADPREQQNLLGARPEKTNEMRERLREVERRMGRPAAAADALRLDPELAEQLAALGYVSTAGGGEVPASDRDPKDYLEVLDRLAEATTLLAGGRRDEAVAALEAAERQDPDNLEVIRRLGQLRLESGEAARARDRFRQLVALAPGSAEAHFKLAQAWIVLGQRARAAGDREASRRASDEALAADLACIDLLPQHERALSDLGGLLAERGEPERAVEMYRRSYEANPRMLIPRYNRALLLGRLGRRDEAIAELEWIAANRPRAEWAGLDVEGLLGRLRTERGAATRPGSRAR